MDKILAYAVIHLVHPGGIYRSDADADAVQEGSEAGGSLFSIPIRSLGFCTMCIEYNLLKKKKTLHFIIS